MSASMRSTLQTVPESVPADHVTNSKVSPKSEIRCANHESISRGARSRAGGEQAAEDPCASSSFVPRILVSERPRAHSLPPFASLPPPPLPPSLLLPSHLALETMRNFEAVTNARSILAEILPRVEKKNLKLTSSNLFDHPFA